MVWRINFELWVGFALLMQVINYVVEKMLLDKPVDSVNPDGAFAPGLVGGQLPHSVVGDGSFRPGLKTWQKLKPAIEILCNNQASESTVWMLEMNFLIRFWLLINI